MIQLQAQTTIVDQAGRPTPIFLKLLNSISGGGTGSLELRVSDLESDVAALETLTTIQGASISALVADVASLEVDLSALTIRVSDNEIRAVFGATVWP